MKSAGGICQSKNNIKNSINNNNLKNININNKDINNEIKELNKIFKKLIIKINNKNEEELQEINNQEELEELQEINNQEELKELEEINKLEELKELEEMNKLEGGNDYTEFQRTIAIISLSIKKYKKIFNEANNKEEYNIIDLHNILNNYLIFLSKYLCYINNNNNNNNTNKTIEKLKKINNILFNFLKNKKIKELKNSGKLHIINSSINNFINDIIKIYIKYKNILP